MPKQSKVEYVLSQRQTREHHCHWTGCTQQCPPAMWGCKKHWFMLPKYLRDRVWSAYRPGQEVNLTPSIEYLEVAEEVQQWIANHYGTSSAMPSSSRNTADGTGSKSSPTCVACNDTGINSKGGVCVPCSRNGRLKTARPFYLGCLFDG